MALIELVIGMLQQFVFALLALVKNIAELGKISLCALAWNPMGIECEFFVKYVNDLFPIIRFFSPFNR